MPMSGKNEVESTAAEWLVTLQDPQLSHEQYLEWERWMEADKCNRRAFDEVARLSRRLAALKAPLADIPLPGAAEVTADAYDASVPVAVWRKNRAVGAGEAGKARYRRGWRIAAAAASFAGFVLLVAALVLPSLPEHGRGQLLQTYQTARSEHRRIDLPDGSVVALGGKSAVSVNYSADRRALVLEEGEALFTVARNPERPFVVVAGSGTITALGTEFNVRRDTARVVVTVTDGTVEVERQRRSAGGVAGFRAPGTGTAASSWATVTGGEQVVYDGAGILGVTAADTELAVSWQRGRLQYRAEPLKYVIEGVNRYSRREVIIADKQVEELTFTGSVFQDQADDWLKGLEDVFPVEIVSVGGNKVLVRAKTERE